MTVPKGYKLHAIIRNKLCFSAIAQNKELNHLAKLLLPQTKLTDGIWSPLYSSIRIAHQKAQMLHGF